MPVKIFRSYVMTGFLVVLLLLSCRYFLTGYREYTVKKDEKAALTSQVKWLSKLKNDRELKLHDILKVNNFVNQAKLLGLEEHKWTVYNVDIQDTVTFPEMKTILKQCSNADSHYFQPVSFHIKSLKEAAATGKVSGMPFENGTGDILMTLKGAFVVKK